TVVVPAVWAASGRGDHDRAGAAVCELSLVVRARELVVVVRQRVQEEGQAEAAGRRRAAGDVDRVGEQLAAHLSDARFRAATAAGGIVGALPVGEVRGQDPVEDAGLR